MGDGGGGRPLTEPPLRALLCEAGQESGPWLPSGPTQPGVGTGGLSKGCPCPWGGDDAQTELGGGARGVGGGVCDSCSEG